MKLFHLSDLHLGKQVHKVSMLPDQAYILQEVLDAVAREQPDAVLLAGDIYDKPQISKEAEKLFDWFQTELVALGTSVFVISGNHDSAAHVGYFSELLKKNGIYTTAPEFSGVAEPVTLPDAFGPVHFWLLPFLKPVDVRAAYPLEDYPEVETDSFHHAIASVLEKMDVNTGERNVLLAHQFVTRYAEGDYSDMKTDSEVLSIGGVDNVGVDAFAPFDYVALGHLHRPQKVGRDTVRYCGTPLKYSFSEVADHKSITVVELGAKGDVQLRTIPLVPLHDMRRLSGTFTELTARVFYETQETEDYLEITLTDDMDVQGAFRQLKTIYPNLLSLRYQREEGLTGGGAVSVQELEEMSPLQIVSGFFAERTGKELTVEQEALLSDLMTEVWRGEVQ